ncbi:hypothetical protein P5V15_009563 [Pogonomyrmex californicus]
MCKKKWRLFHATDFQSLLHPCFILCSILGMFPYKFNNSTFEASKPRYIISTIIFCIFCVYGVLVFYELDISKTTSVSVPRYLERHCYFILGIFVMIVTFTSRDPQLLLLQTLLKISSKLPPKSYQKLSKLIHVKDIFFFSFVVMIGIVCVTYMPRNLNIYTIFTFYLTLLLLQIDMLYMNCVCVLKVCFKKINDDLTNIMKLVMNDEPHLLRRIYHEQRNPFLLMELRALRKQHLIVSDTVRMLNMIFSLQLLVTIIMTFIEITFNLYFYIVILIIQETMKFWYWFFIVFVVYFSIKIILIVWVCDNSKDQAVKIGITVHNLINSINDKQIRDELELFSLQILHRENTFSAKGVTVDATLLTAMVGSITTYLLILIQFLITSHSCDRNGIDNGTEII